MGGPGGEFLFLCASDVALREDYDDLDVQIAGWQPYPEGSSTHCLKTVVPKTIPLMAFGTRVLK